MDFRSLNEAYKQVNKQFIDQPRLIVREFNTKADVKRAIVDANPNLKSGADKRGAIRIGPASKVEDRKAFEQEFLDTLKDIKLVVTREIKPGSLDSPSSKFPSYVVQDTSGEEYVITLAGGSFSNKGMMYEREVLKEIQTYFNDPENNAKPDFIEQIEQALDTTFVDVNRDTSFLRNVKRPLSSKPNDMGKDISDITLINDKGDTYYLSLKDVGGKTVGNSGASGMFDVKDGEVKFTNRERDGIGKKLMNASGVNIDDVLDGLQDYIDKTPSNERQSEPHDTTDEADLKQLQEFIGSAFDYGYIYVKRKNTKNDLEVADLSDEKKLYDFIGDVQSVSVKYPYYRDEKNSRKHISINIRTTKGNYSFDIRNASGGQIPNQINLVRGNSSKDAKAVASNVDGVEKSDAKLTDLLSQNY